MSIARQKHAANDAVRIEVRVARLDFSPVDLVDLDCEGPGERCLPAHFFEAIRCQGDRDRAVALHAGRDAGFGLERMVELGRVAGEAGQVLRRAQLADQSGRMPGGATRELLSLQKDDVIPAEQREVIGNGTPGHAAADNDGAGLVWRSGGHWRLPIGHDLIGCAFGPSRKRRATHL